MKKIISLILVLAMVFCLAACGGKKGPEILGTYEIKVDMLQLAVDSFDEGTGVTAMSMADYLDDFSFVLVSVFNEDGTYSQNVDEASINAALDNLKVAASAFMRDYMIMLFEEQLGISGQQAIEDYIGMTIDEACELSLGYDLEGFVDVVIDESMDVEAVMAESVTAGKYKAEDGKLYLSQSAEEEPSDEAYETYTIKDNVVTVTGGVNVEEEEFLPYPFEMVKVA